MDMTGMMSKKACIINWVISLGLLAVIVVMTNGFGLLQGKPDKVYLEFPYADRIDVLEYDGVITDKQDVIDIVDDINYRYTVKKQIDGISDYKFCINLQDKHHGEWDTVGFLYVIDEKTVAFEGVGNFAADEDIVIPEGSWSRPDDGYDFMWVMEKDDGKIDIQKIKQKIKKTR